ncbi:MAG: hypothetical protein U1E05_12260, partial [Patescibacteria group bacterium]|nr:hypothetical protein [Patescibacteria group bacterium]
MTYRLKVGLRIPRNNSLAMSLGMAALVAMTAGLVGFQADRAVAATYWKALASDNDWKNAANWDNGLPSTSNDACFNGPSSFTTISLNGDVNVGSFVFSGATCA